MAVVELTIQEIEGEDAVVPAYVQANTPDGNKYPNGDGYPWISIKNDGADPATVTFVAESACDQGFLHNTAVVVADGTEARVPPRSRERFNDALEFVKMTYAGDVSDLKVGVFRVTPA